MVIAAGAGVVVIVAVAVAAAVAAAVVVAAAAMVTIGCEPVAEFDLNFKQMPNRNLRP